MKFTPKSGGLVERGYAATVVAAALLISRSSLYYEKQRRQQANPSGRYDLL